MKHVCGAEGGAELVVFISSFETKEAVFPEIGQTDTQRGALLVLRKVNGKVLTLF